MHVLSLFGFVQCGIIKREQQQQQQQQRRRRRRRRRIKEEDEEEVEPNIALTKPAHIMSGMLSTLKLRLNVLQNMQKRKSASCTCNPAVQQMTTAFVGL